MALSWRLCDSLQSLCQSERNPEIPSVGLTSAAQRLQPHPQMSPVGLRSDHLPHHPWNALRMLHTWGYPSSVLVLHWLFFAYKMAFRTSEHGVQGPPPSLSYKLPALQSTPLRIFLFSRLPIRSPSTFKSHFLYETLWPPQTGLF